jgi:hypothetical protein
VALKEAYSEDVLDKIEGLYPQLDALDSSSYLPIAQLSIPNLRQMSKPQYQNFRARMTDLIKADNKVTLFEFCLVKVLTHHLDGTFGNQTRNRGIYKRLSDVKPQIQLLLSILAFMPDKDQKSAQMAFDEGCQAFDENAFGEMLTLLPEEQFGFDKLDSALDKLERTTGKIKKQIVSAASRCIRADDKVDTEEMELLRTICEIIEVPIPPLLRRE